MNKLLARAVRFLPKRWRQVAWHVQKPVCRIHHQTHLVSARVAGDEVWFESADLPLAPTMEGFASMFLAVAYHRQARLRLDAPVDAAWMQNIGNLSGVYRRWWPRLEELAVDGSVLPASTVPRQPGRVLFFSGGVDSFYSLLQGPAVDALVYAHGFDASPDDHHHGVRQDQELREVASDTGHRAVSIRTNLRQHRQFRTVNWELTHGGALTGAAHLLSDAFGQAVISSSDTGAGLDDVPWGTHQETDPLYSSAVMAIQHFGESVYRQDKLRALAGEPIVRQHLRVCWEHRTSEMNCCQCEKCLRKDPRWNKQF